MFQKAFTPSVQDKIGKSTTDTMEKYGHQLYWLMIQRDMMDNEKYWEETDVSLLMLYKEKRDASRKDMDAANSSYQVFSGLLAVGWLYSAVTAYLEGPGTLKYLERKRQATSNMDMNVAFNHEQQKMQLEFSIPLR